MKTSFDGGPKDGGPEISSGPPPVLGPLRTCTKCGEVKVLGEFYRDRVKTLGYRSDCKRCNSKKMAKWRKDNLEHHRQTAREWGEKNKDRKNQTGKRWREENAEKHRQNARDYYLKNKQGYKDRRRSRRAKTAGSEVSSVDLAQLWTGWCALCGGTMDYDLEYPDPQSKSLDHDIPLALGGAHSKENLQWSHLACNLSKGARI